ncbi:CHASE2 domain-containing protein [Leptolyngbya cf. ectocarpi LEGE 11479]|uniref:CHASE2 domain-containing protein n=1 Tax=Leptolyngbya cf. ectocarpi LEGE 11479 TaxID=1828722 RepID=A0A929FAQ1_LEPEC|nr:CHASE2 domain-containing protein [Leptolyngbya ectocarpi]MBE9068364.1 CHASE2 domain-containing protein [Leptolyngbya cf. ectocarpi LEGE 11479]
MKLIEDWFLNIQSGFIPKLSIVGILAVARLLGLLQPMEWKVWDVIMRGRPAEIPDQRITIVTITEDDIQQSLNYPIPDHALAELIEVIQTYDPRVIGLDIFRNFPVGEGYEMLAETFASSENLIGINKVTGKSVAAPKSLPLERVGFADIVADADGIIRRSILGGPDSEGKFQYSFAVRVSEAYLAQEDFFLENGIHDSRTMRFGDAEVPRFHSSTGGYAWTNDAGIQTLLHFRAGKTPFATVTYGDLLADNVAPDVLRDRVVLVGYQAESAKDLVTVAALPGVNPSEVPGIVLQAHAISQIVSATLDNRAFLRTLPSSVEYILLVLAGSVGLSLAASRLKPYMHTLVVIIGSGGLGLIFYAAILTGWWLPLVPVGAAFAVTAVVMYPVYQMQAQLESELGQREQLINWTFGTIHNGPLQTLARLLKEWPDNSHTPDYEKNELKELNIELRALYDMMRQEMLMPEGQLALSQQRVINLDMPLIELLDEVYRTTARRRQDFFGGLLHITDFQDIEDSFLAPRQKRELGRFLEEALLNVCKYATGTTRLKITCRPEGSDNIIRVVDNGQGNAVSSDREGYGTQQAKQLARKLGGKFNRSAVIPKGTQCELRWPINKQRWPSWASLRWFKPRTLII